MIYLIIAIGCILGFWMIVDLISDHAPARSPLARVERARRGRGR